MRESLQVMYKINRDKTVCEGLVFLLWCFVFFFVVFGVSEGRCRCLLSLATSVCPHAGALLLRFCTLARCL